jgi:hypothetical protein
MLIEPSVASRANADGTVSGPTATAESAEVAVVALTTSERDVPRSALREERARRCRKPGRGRQPGDLRVTTTAWRSTT